MFLLRRIDVGAMQARLAVAKTANDEPEVDDSLLNVGALNVIMLQAADILAYR
jgi:tryptophanyl-tRNA synthetase